MRPEAGQPAPAIELPDGDGRVHRLADYRGSWVLVYFYPKDNTSGCTKEACAIRDVYPRFGKLDAVVLGVSVDPVKSHRSFADRHELPFTLLSDEKKEVVKRWGAWGKKKFMGREYMGTSRISFLVDPGGTIAKIYEKVKPASHAEEVLADLEALRE